MKKREIKHKTKTSTKKNCNHYWIIESPYSAISRGVCKYCGSVKEFKNHLRDCVPTGDDEYKAWLGRKVFGNIEKEDDTVSELEGGVKDAIGAAT
jgi:hypothetical protein